jgi:hypothetical protein
VSVYTVTIDYDVTNHYQAKIEIPVADYERWLDREHETDNDPALARYITEEHDDLGD